MIRALLFVFILKFQTCKAEKHVADIKKIKQENTKEILLNDILNNKNANFNSDKTINVLNELLNLYDEFKKSQVSDLAETFLKNDNKKTEPNVLPWLLPDFSDSPKHSPIRIFTNFPWNKRVANKLMKDKQAPALPWLIPNFYDSFQKNDNNIKTLIKLPWFRYDNSISIAPRPWNKEELEELIYGDNRKLDNDILLKRNKISRSSNAPRPWNKEELEELIYGDNRKLDNDILLKRNKISRYSDKAVLLRWLKDTIESYEDREKPRLYFGSAIMPWNKQEADSFKDKLKIQPQKNKKLSFKSLWKRLESLRFQRGLENNELKSPWRKEDLSVESFLKGMESLRLLRNYNNLHNDANFQTNEDTTLKNLISSIEKENSKINNEIANYELYEKINEFLSSKNSSETDS